MKSLALAVGTVVSVALGLLAIPLIVGGNSNALAGGCGDVAAILTTIRTIESGGNYTARNPHASASGAYQYIDVTWRRWATIAGVDTATYPSAWTAPPTSQDAASSANVADILAHHGGDVAVIPVVWYWPRALDHPDEMDKIPRADAGNTLTVRQYQTRWLAVYATNTGSVLPVPSTSTNTLPTSSTTVATCDGGLDDTGVPANIDGYSLPLPRRLLTAEMLRAPHHDYPAIDLLVPIGTPVYAIYAGTVTRLVSWPYNCWDLGRCDEPCGIGLSINGDDGTRYIYCHGTQLNVTDGQQIEAGQVIMWTGNTGRSRAPHLHLELKQSGVRVDPRPLLGVVDTYVATVSTSAFYA